MRLAELYGMGVRGSDGRRLGAVREVHAENGEVVALGVGASSLLERLTGGRKGRRIAWTAVVAKRGGELVVDDS
jgi:sporulation protein YlmC with PRC-barrel domain